MMSSSFSFVLATAALGMAVVFVFLTLLSLLMKAIRSVDSLIDRAPAPPHGDRPSSPEAGAAAPQTTPVWVTAAVAAFLDAELSVHAHSATAWTSRSVR